MDLYQKFFDGSGLKNMPQINIGVPGYMKDESPNEIIEKFVGLCSKSYSYTTNADSVIKRGGLIRNVAQKLTIRDYIEVFENQIHLMRIVKKIGSENLDIFTYLSNKIALNYKDDKRMQIANSCRTIPWGHYHYRENEKEDEIV